MSVFEVRYGGTPGNLIINNLEISDKEVIDLIESFKEDEKEAKIKEILTLGVKAMKSFLTESYGMLIDTRFDSGTQKLDSEIKSQILNINSKIIQPLTEELRDKIMKKFIDMIDEKKNDLDKKVFDNFKNDLNDRVFKNFTNDFGDISHKLQDALLKYVTEKKVIEETPKKGYEFEDYIFRQVDSISNYFGDAVTHIGSDNKAGDILVKNETDGLTFAIEVRDRSMTEPDITRTFEDVERVRGVLFSMIVVNNQEELPQKVGPFKVYGNNRIIVALSTGVEDDFTYFLLSSTYRMMRFLALASKQGAKGIDVKEIKDKIDHIRSIIGKTKSMKTKITKFSSEMTNDLDTLKDEVNDVLTNMEGMF